MNFAKIAGLNIPSSKASFALPDVNHNNRLLPIIKLEQETHSSRRVGGRNATATLLLFQI
jgi:hypothetical protein